MQENGWFFEKAKALTGDYEKIDFQFSAKHLKIRASATCQISFNGKEDDSEVLVADGLVDFQDVNKGEIHVKGSGTVDITAWDGN